LSKDNSVDEGEVCCVIDVMTLAWEIELIEDILIYFKPRGQAK